MGEFGLLVELHWEGSVPAACAACLFLHIWCVKASLYQYNTNLLNDYRNKIFIKFYAFSKGSPLEHQYLRHLQNKHNKIASAPQRVDPFFLYL